MSKTTNDIITTLNDAIESVETETSELAGGVRAVVADEDVGKLMGAMRRNGIDFESKRDPSGDNLIVNISVDDDATDDDQRGLGDLFK